MQARTPQDNEAPPAGEPVTATVSIAAGREVEARARAKPVRDLVRYWISLHHGDGLPARRDFEPLDVPSLLSSLVLTDIERDPFRIRFRLVGTRVVEAFDGDFTGHYYDEVIPDWRETYGYRHRRLVAETGLPSYRTGPSSMNFRYDFAPIERIHLPLADDGRQVDMILSLTVYNNGR